MYAMYVRMSIRVLIHTLLHLGPMHVCKHDNKYLSLGLG